MKKTFYALTFGLLSCWGLKAQILTLPLTEGGANNGGTILKVDATSGTSIVKSMNGALEASEINLNIGHVGGLYYEASNNAIYIALDRGGRKVGTTDGQGVIYKYDVTNNTVDLIVRLEASSKLGARPIGAMTKVGNKLYGVTQYGGAFNKGVIYSIDLSNNDKYMVEHSFNGTSEGGEPSCALFNDNNVLYGAGVYSNGSAGQNIFKYDPSSQTFTNLYNQTGGTINIRGMFVKNNILYLSKGIGIDKFDLANPTAPTIHYMGLDANLGSIPSGFVQRPSNGKWYTVFQELGINNFGTIAEVTNNSSTPVIVTHQMAGGSAGQHPYTGLVNGVLNKMYGVAPSSSVGNNSILYELSDLDVYSVSHTFSNGIVRMTPVLVGTKLYGIDEIGGVNGAGTIWCYDLANSQYSSKLDLGYADGRSPVNSLVDMGNGKSIGITFAGGSKGRGTLIEFNDNTQAIRKICSLDSSLTFATWYKPFTHNGQFYILTNVNSAYTGTYNSPFVISKIDTTTGMFSQTTALSPGSLNFIQTGNIVQSANVLYGANSKEIWKFDLATMTYTNLYTYSGNLLTGGTFLKDSLLFIAVEDITSNTGFLSKLNLNTNTYSSVAPTATGKYLYSVVGDNTQLYSYEIDKATQKGKIVAIPYSSYSPSQLALIDSVSVGYQIDDAYLILADGNLYGLTTAGSDHGLGSIFKCNISTGTVSKLIALSKATGYLPFRCEMRYQVGSLNGIEELGQNGIQMTAYPNPVIDKVNFSIHDLDLLTIYSSTGSIVFEGKNISNVNTAQLKQGVYYVVGVKDNLQYQTKFVK